MKNLVNLYKEKSSLLDISESSCKFKFENRKSLEEHLTNFFYLISLEQTISKGCEEMKFNHKFNYPEFILDLSLDIHLKFTFYKNDDISKGNPFRYTVETQPEMLQNLFNIMRKTKFEYEIFKKSVIISSILYSNKSTEYNVNFKGGESILKSIFMGIKNLPDYRYLFEPKAIEIYEERQTFALNIRIFRNVNDFKLMRFEFVLKIEWVGEVFLEKIYPNKAEKDLKSLKRLIKFEYSQ